MTSRGLWRVMFGSAIGLVHLCCLPQTPQTNSGAPPADPASAASAAPKAAAASASAAKAAQAQDADKLMSDVIALIPQNLKPYADLSLSTIKLILVQNSEGQAAVYEFARTINVNIGNVGGTLYKDVRAQTEKLIDASYSDNIRQNANLSNQLKTRLKGLIADSLLIQSDTLTPAVRQIRQDEFLRELTLLTERYVYSKQFRAGVGLSYLYLPQMSYVAFPNIDLSPFQNQEFGGSGRALFLADFSNRSSLALTLSAKCPTRRWTSCFPPRIRS